MRPKKCKSCGAKFIPDRPLQSVCSMQCAITHGKVLSAKKTRAEIKSRKEKLKSLSELANEAQFYVNKYVRLRDRKYGCISCDRPPTWDGQWHASHFKSIGANSALRFNLWNIHKSCSICNNHLSGNIGEYSRRLPDRIGMEKFNYLNSSPRSMKFTREYLIRLKRVAQKACKRKILFS